MLRNFNANVAQSVEQRFRKPQVKGSSPFIGSIFRGVAQFGSAFGSGPKGRRFKSCHLDHFKGFRENRKLFLLRLRSINARQDLKKPE